MRGAFVIPAGLFDPSTIDPETREINARIEAAANAAPPRSEMSVEVERALPRGGGMLPPAEPCRDAVDRTVPGPAGPIGVRIFPTQAPTGLYLHFHGGGFCLGAANGQDDLLAAIRQETGACVISVDYRLAPENPYPAAQDDAEAVALWLAERGQQEFGASGIVLGGESAGAHLALTTVMRLRDRHGFTGFAGANLVYGAYDMRLTAGARLWGERRLVLNTPTYLVHLDRYLAAADREDPDISPLLASLRDLPPALLSVGTLDLCLEDNLFMYARWVAAGRPAELAVYPGAIHGFTLMPGGLGREANARSQDFISRCFRGDPVPATSDAGPNAAQSL